MLLELRFASFRLWGYSQFVHGDDAGEEEKGRSQMECETSDGVLKACAADRLQSGGVSGEYLVVRVADGIGR